MMKRTVSQIADHVQARVAGDGSAILNGVASVRAASAGDLIFIENDDDLSAALQSPASAVIVPESTQTSSQAKPLLIAKNPRLAFARAAELLCPLAISGAGIHPSAVVHASVSLAEGVTVEAHATIGENAAIGSGTRIGSGCVVGAGVQIGRNCVLYPRVVIYPGARLGDRVIAHAGAVLGSDGFGYVRDAATGRHVKFPQVGRLEIEDDVEIGANTTIDRGALEVTRIARGAKIDNLVHIGHNCQIGENVIIAAQTGLSGSIVLEDNVVLGGQVGIGEHARLEEGVMLGGQGGVLPKKVLRGKGVAYWGTPAQPVKEYLKQLASLARLSKK